jgi:hypothetical protein
MQGQPYAIVCTQPAQPVRKTNGVRVLCYEQSGRKPRRKACKFIGATEKSTSKELPVLDF